MHAVSASAARKHWSKILNRVEYRGERIWITRHGMARAAVVCAADLNRLEHFEERDDIRRSAGPHQEVLRGEVTSWFELRQGLGL